MPRLNPPFAGLLLRWFRFLWCHLRTLSPHNTPSERIRYAHRSTLSLCVIAKRIFNQSLGFVVFAFLHANKRRSHRVPRAFHGHPELLAFAAFMLFFEKLVKFVWHFVLRGGCRLTRHSS